MARDRDVMLDIGIGASDGEFGSLGRVPVPCGANVVVPVC